MFYSPDESRLSEDEVRGRHAFMDRYQHALSDTKRLQMLYYNIILFQSYELQIHDAIHILRETKHAIPLNL